MTKTAVRRPVTTFMVILIFIAFGAMSLMNLKMDLLPNMNIPVAVVYTTYVGASPEQIQKQITEPIEKSLATISGLDTMASTSSENLSLVILQFEQKVDINFAAIDMREAVDMVKGSLPEDAGEPAVMKMDINSMSAIYLSVSSDSEDIISLKNKVDNQLADRLTRQDGVASVNVSGGRDKEIRVDVREDRIRGYGISEAQISGLLKAENASMPLGSVKDAGRTLTIKLDGQFAGVEDIRSLPITTAAGGVVSLGDVADVYESYVESTSFALLNGQPAVTLTIQKQSTANTVNVSRAVMGELERIQRDYPELSVSVILDPADYIEQSIGSVADSALMGMLLAMLVLFVFLRNVRSTLVVGAAIPVSILVTFALMYFAGMTLNLMSLGGLTLGVGMLVDNSIVVLESIFRRMEQGEGKVRAAINGAREVSMSIMASTLTTVAVFVPVAWVGGMIAQVFNDLAVSISFSLMASLAVALTFVPLGCALFLEPSGAHKRENFITRFFDWIGRGLQGIENAYRRALNFVTSRRKRVWILTLLFFVGSMTTLALIGWELLPAADQSQIDISVSLPAGAVLERTQAVTAQVLERIGRVPEVRDVSTIVGGGGMMGMGGGGSTASITVTLPPMKERSRTSTQIADEMRVSMHDIAGAEIKVEALTSMMGAGVAGSTADVQYRLKGSEIEPLSEAAEKMVELIRDVPGVRDPQSSVSTTIPQATIRVDRLKASSMGLSGQSVMGVVSAAVSGSGATSLKTAGNEITVRVGRDKESTGNLEALGSLLIPSPLGMSVPLREIADISVTETPRSIGRENQVIYVTVSASLDGRDLGAVSADITKKLESEFIMPAGVSLETAGSQQQLDDEMRNLIFAFFLAILVVYAIMAAEFESMYYPLVIMGAVPLAFSAGVMGLFVMGQTMNITSALGFIILVGVVINNAIVLVDYINLLRGRGLGLMEAVCTAGPVRLRAILMTTLTTVLGLLPMMLGAQEGSEMMQPLATVIVWGLGISTLLTLFVVPVTYVTFEHIRARLLGERKRFRRIEEMREGDSLAADMVEITEDED